MHEKEKIEQRWPAAVDFIKERKLNEVFDGDIDDVGIILQGGMYNGVIRALQGLGLADVWGNTRIPLYVMNVTYPLIDDELVEFCRSKRAVLMVEEGQPDYIEQALNKILRKARRPDQDLRQGRAADRRRIYRGRDGGGRSQLPHRSRARRAAGPGPRARTIHRSSPTTRSRRWPRWCRRARPASAPAARSGRSSPP